MTRRLGTCTTGLYLALLVAACNRSTEPKVDPGPIAQTNSAKGVGESGSGIPKQTQPDTPAGPVAPPKTPDTYSPKEPGAKDPAVPIAPKSDLLEKAVAPSRQDVAGYLANRLALDALLREDRINKLPGLRTPVVAALARVPGIGFEERAAWGLLLLSTGSTDLEKAQRGYRFARVSIYEKAELADAEVMISLRKSELALYRKEGRDEPIAEELRVCQRLTAETAPAVVTLAATADVKKLAAVREKLVALFLETLEDPVLLKEITEGEMLLQQATTAELRAAQDNVRKLLGR